MKAKAVDVIMTAWSQGWTRIVYWTDPTGKNIHWKDLCGINPDGKFDFLPDPSTIDKDMGDFLD